MSGNHPGYELTTQEREQALASAHALRDRLEAKRGARRLFPLDEVAAEFGVDLNESEPGHGSRTYFDVVRSLSSDPDVRRAVEETAAETRRDRESKSWRVGQHYGIHVYEGDRPVATFHDPAEAAEAVAAVNEARVRRHDST